MAAKRPRSDPELFCDVCEEQFEYPCRFKRHLATHRHKMFSEALEMNVVQESVDLTIAPDPYPSEHQDPDPDNDPQVFFSEQVCTPYQLYQVDMY